MQLTVLDVAAGFAIALLLIGGMVYGGVQGDRGVFSVASILTGLLILWRVTVWNEADTSSVDVGIVSAVATSLHQ